MSARQLTFIHSKEHMAEKLSVCNYCWKTFFDNLSLKKHEEFHIGEQPQLCDHCVGWGGVHAQLSSTRGVHKKTELE